MNHQDNPPPRTVPMPADLLPLLRTLLAAMHAMLAALGIDTAAVQRLAEWAATAEHQDVDSVLVGRTGSDATAARTARHLQSPRPAAPPMVRAAQVLADVATRLDVPGLTATVHQWDTGVSVHVTVPTARPLEERRQLIAAAQTLGDLKATPYDDGAEITSVTVRDWQETGVEVRVTAYTADPEGGAE